LSIDDDEIGSQSRLYQPEALSPSGPGLALSTKNNFGLFPFFLSDHPLDSVWVWISQLSAQKD